LSETAERLPAAGRKDKDAMKYARSERAHMRQHMRGFINLIRPLRGTIKEKPQRASGDDEKERSIQVYTLNHCRWHLGAAHPALRFMPPADAAATLAGSLAMLLRLIGQSHALKPNEDRRSRCRRRRNLLNQRVGH